MMKMSLCNIVKYCSDTNHKTNIVLNHKMLLDCRGC